MSQNQILMFAVLGLGLLVFVLGLYILGPKRIILRQLEKMNRTDLADVDNDQVVKISGVVKAVSAYDISHPGYNISPMAQRICVYSHTLVRGRTNSKRGYNTGTLIDEIKQLDFELEDDTGKAFVRFCTDLRHLHVIKHFENQLGKFNQASSQVQQYFETHGKSDKTWTGLSYRHLKISEKRIEVGERIVIVGLASWEIDESEEQNPSAEPVKRLVIRGDKKQYLLVTDDPDWVRLP